MSYAQGTTVAPEKSELEIKLLLKKYGAEKFTSGWDETHAHVCFTVNGLTIQFAVRMPNPQDPKYSSRKRRTSGRRRWDAATSQWVFSLGIDSGTAYNAEVRRLWRALALVIKGKLEAVDSGITSFEEEFLSYVMTNNGKTIGEALIPQISEAAKSGRMLPAIGGSSASW